ncbi:MAG: ribbon-helix-helix protein, CopG family [Syntrophomonadaceae bacterium]|nr:ribbon-helix-helix protein, CopG family [Syntrophomonadaceae bacterium]
MPTSKRINILIPENLLNELDCIAASKQNTRSELVEEALDFYFKENKRQLFIEQMKTGYTEMADVNLKIADDFREIEDEADREIIEKIME